MKKILKGIMTCVLLLAGVITLCSSRCSAVIKPIPKSAINKATQSTVKMVNRATRATEKTVNEAVTNSASNPGIQRAVLINGGRSLQRTVPAQAQKQNQWKHLQTCPKCNGKGATLGNDGFYYNCSVCNGTGQIATR